MIILNKIQNAIKNSNMSLPVITSSGKVRLTISASDTGNLWKIKYRNFHGLLGKIFST